MWTEGRGLVFLVLVIRRMGMDSKCFVFKGFIGNWEESVFE